MITQTGQPDQFPIEPASSAPEIMSTCWMRLPSAHWLPTRRLYIPPMLMVSSRFMHLTIHCWLELKTSSGSDCDGSVLQGR